MFTAHEIQYLANALLTCQLTVHTQFEIFDLHIRMHVYPRNINMKKKYLYFTTDTLSGFDDCGSS